MFYKGKGNKWIFDSKRRPSDIAKAQTISKPKAAEQEKERLCLKGDHMFLSWGIGNRICDSCKRTVNQFSHMEGVSV